MMKPRHHAAEILKLKTLEERRAYLKRNVPPAFQEWVKIYVRLWWKGRKKNEVASD